MIDFMEFLDNKPDFFEEDSNYFTCLDRGFPTCMDTKMEHNEPGKLEFKDKAYGDSILTLDLESLIIEHGSKKYTIDESKSEYTEGNPEYHDGLTIYTVPTGAKNELREVHLRKL